MGSLRPACRVNMREANIDLGFRKRGHWRYGRDRRTMIRKQSKTSSWRRLQGQGSVSKRVRLSQRAVGRSTLNSKASLLWEERHVRLRRKKRSQTLKKKTEIVKDSVVLDIQKQPGVQDIQSKIRINRRYETKFSHRVKKYKGGYRRQTRNSRMRHAPPLPIKCSVCHLEMSGRSDLREHMQSSPICDLRNFILLRPCYVWVARGHMKQFEANMGPFEEEDVLTESSGTDKSIGTLDEETVGFIPKQVFMEALGLDLRGIITDDNWEEEDIEESTKACDEHLHQVDPASEAMKVRSPGSWTTPLLYSSSSLLSSWTAFNSFEIPPRFFLRSLSACILSPKSSR